MWALGSYSFHYLFMVFKQPLVSNLKPHCFHLDISLKRSSNILNWLSRIPTQYSLVNSELFFFITIQYTIIFPDMGSFNYISVVVILIYLSGNTRTDIAFAVNYCAIFFLPRINTRRLWIELVGIWNLPGRVDWYWIPIGIYSRLIVIRMQIFWIVWKLEANWSRMC